MRTTRLARSPRRGFTLVELLVAAALCILIMTILATAFQSGLQTLSHLKSAVTLSEQLRTAEDVLRRDLSAVHLEDEFGRPVKLSQMPAGQWTSTADLPRKGYFSIKQPSVPVQLLDATARPYDAVNGTLQAPIGPQLAYPFLANTAPYDTATLTGLQNRARYPFQWEGIEDGVDSFRATDHTISMTVKLSGKTAQEVFTSATPPVNPQLGQQPFSRVDLDPTFGGQVVTPWAEVVWFLRPVSDPINGVTAEYSDPSDPTVQTRQKLQLYSLHRSQRVIPSLPTSLPFNVPAPVPPALLNTFREAFPELSIATVRPLSAKADLFPNPPFPGYPQGYRGANPWQDPNVVVAQVNTPETVTDPLNRTEYIVDWLRFATNTNQPPNLLNLLPAGYQLSQSPTGLPTVVNPGKVGSDLVLNNVVSMEVRVLTDASGSGVVPRHLPPYLNANFSPPFGNGVAPFAIQPRFYDSYYGGTVGGTQVNTLNPHRIRAVQLKIRVYDIKNNMTRQMTVTQDL
jgi:type II secretory pathway pseudopilin PulG